jgi:hypothetical protein
MRKHNGMRPQDVAILLKIVAINEQQWQLVGLSNLLHISISEISESLNRSRLANLIDHKKKKVNKENFLEFLIHGVRYVFPQQPGSMARGVATAHSHPLIKKKFISELNYIWPYSKGETLGLIIEPFYPNQVEAVKADPLFHKLLALIDLIRVGKVREVKYAISELQKIFSDESSHK